MLPELMILAPPSCLESLLVFTPWKSAIVLIPFNRIVLKLEHGCNLDIYGILTGIIFKLLSGNLPAFPRSCNTIHIILYAGICNDKVVFETGAMQDCWMLCFNF